MEFQTIVNRGELVRVRVDGALTEIIKIRGWVVLFACRWTPWCAYISMVKPPSLSELSPYGVRARFRRARKQGRTFTENSKRYQFVDLAFFASGLDHFDLRGRIALLRQRTCLRAEQECLAENPGR